MATPIRYELTFKLSRPDDFYEMANSRMKAGWKAATSNYRPGVLDGTDSVSIDSVLEIVSVAAQDIGRDMLARRFIAELTDFSITVFYLARMYAIITGDGKINLH